MNWHRFLKSSQRQVGHRTAHWGQHRPNLEILEDRTLLTKVTFGIVQKMSSLTISGTFTAEGNTVPIQQQGPGSLKTSYTGTIATDIDFRNMKLNFLDTGTALIADISGNWQPKVGGGAGADPANYGGQFALLGNNLAAIRDLVAGFKDTTVNLARGGGATDQFLPNLTFKTNEGNLDYATTLFGNGRVSVAGNSGSNQATSTGTLKKERNTVYVLTIPVNANLVIDFGGGASTNLNVAGFLAGTGVGQSTSSSKSDEDAAIDLSQVVGVRFSVGWPLTADGATPTGSGAAVLPKTLPAASASVAPSQVSVSGLDGVVSHVVHSGSTAGVDSLAALDTVFGDPVAGTVTPFYC